VAPRVITLRHAALQVRVERRAERRTDGRHK
jgi:hypothetical protein